MLSEIISSVQVKHLVQLTVCLLTVYLLRARQSYCLVPSWRKDLDPSVYRNGLYPEKSEKLPTPIVTDLDGDGTLEAVFVTNELKLEVCQGFVAGQEPGAALPHTRVINSVILARSSNGGVIGRPVVMATGYLDQYLAEDQIRKQVIVVLLSNWLVLCYDHELNLLWKQVVMDLSWLKSDYEPQSMTILISPHCVIRGDRGLIIVGGSHKHMAHGHSRSGTLPESPDYGQEVSEHDDHGNNINDLLGGFSSFALDGANGTVRWNYFPGMSDQQTDLNFDAFHWKLSLRRGHWPHGKVHWSRFGTYLLQHMPHHWHSLRDTRINVAHLRKSDKEDREDASDPSSQLVNFGLVDKHVIGQPFGGMRPHSADEHIQNPNAIVIHSHQGLQVLSLQSGQLITDLYLDSTNAVFADINEDNSLDQIRVSPTDSCQGEASAIHPKPKAIFAGDICRMTSIWSTDSAVDHNQDPLPPITVKSIAKPRGLLNHLLGKALPSETHGYDSIFISSEGLLTSFSYRGLTNWKTQTNAKWSERMRSSEPYRNHQQQNWAKYYESFQPAMLPFKLQVFGHENWALISSWDTLLIVHLKDGYIDAEHSLPCQPLDSPIIVDFDADGWNDVIIMCPSGYVGFSVQHQPKYVYMSVLSITIILSMVLLSWCCQVDKDQMKNYDM